MARYRGKSNDVKIYRVGGSVRDELLGRPVADRDWVVVGATPEILVASGYKPVGRDFPVFIHRDTGEEYALARTERKHGRGYRGFEFFGVVRSHRLEYVIQRLIEFDLFGFEFKIFRTVLHANRE